jgi:hypothetical protein
MIYLSQPDYVVDEEVLVLPQDLQQTGNCNRGARAYFVRNGYDWKKFVREGMKIKELKIFDEYIRAAYEQALKRIDG